VLVIEVCGRRKIMHDLGQRRKLERAVDEMLESPVQEAATLALQAKEALAGHKYERAEELVNKALKVHRPPQSLARILVDKAGMPSMAQARRAIQSGKAQIDGVRARKWDQMIRPGQEVKFNGQVVSK
jgi:tyrosyl-tRNA synthetase